MTGKVRGLAAVAVLIALDACMAHGSPGTTSSFAPLRACETRDLSVRDTEVVLVSNADARLGSITIKASDKRTRDTVRNEVVRVFGVPSPDPRVFTKPWRLGLTQVVDACGRVVMPKRSSLPSP